MECDNTTEINIFNKLYPNEVIAYAMLTFNIVFGTWCTSASVFILILMLKSGISRTESLFVVNISVGDLIVGLSFITSAFMHFSGCISYNSYKIYSYYSAIAPVLTSSFSFQSLFSATLERYVKICHPFRHDKISSKTVQFSLLAFNIALSIACSAAMIFSAEWSSSEDYVALLMGSTNGGSIFTAVCLSIEMMTLFYFNVRILRIARSHRNQIHSLEGQNTNGSRSPVKGAALLRIMMLFMFLCYAPILIVFLVSRTVQQGSQMMNNLGRAAVSVQMINNCLNPVLFVWKDRKIKQTLKRIMFR